jgi:hypothetical protein
MAFALPVPLSPAGKRGELLRKPVQVIIEATLKVAYYPCGNSTKPMAEQEITA